MLSYYHGRRCAVLGASGLIGSYAVKLLSESGAWVKAVTHRRQPNEYTNLAHDVIGCDLLDAYQCRKAIDGCDVVVSCAGITGGIGLVSVDPVSYVGPATAMAANVLHCCHEARVRCGFLSSTTVYAPQNVPVREHHLGGEPYHTYRGIGHSKRFLEQFCAYYHETVGLEVAVVRPSGAYGRWDNFDERTSHFIPGMISRALALKPGEPFEVWGDGEDTRDVVHAEDVARGYLLAIAKAPNADPINIASGVGVSTAKMARVILDAVGSRAEITFNPAKPTALKYRYVDIGKATRVLGYEPSVSLESGIADTVAWRRQTCAF